MIDYYAINSQSSLPYADKPFLETFPRLANA